MVITLRKLTFGSQKKLQDQSCGILVTIGSSVMLKEIAIVVKMSKSERMIVLDLLLVKFTIMEPRHNRSVPIRKVV